MIFTVFNSKRSTFIVVIVLLLCTSIHPDGQDLRRRHRQIIQAVEREDWARAEARLMNLVQASPRAFSNNGYGYLLGRVSQQLGKIEEARRAFLKVIGQGSLLSDYALWHLAACSRLSGDLDLEREYLERLVRAYPDSLLVKRSRLRMAENTFESMDDRKAIAAFGELAKGRSSQAREAQLMIGRAQLRMGQTEQARAIFEGLLKRSRDDVALEAVRLLDDLDGEREGLSSPREHLTRARIYQFNRVFGQARRHYLEIVNRFSESPDVPEALFEIGRGYYQVDAFDDAIVWYERVHDRFPQSRYGEQGYYQAGHSHASARRWTEAVKRYEEFISAYPKSETFTGAYLNTIDALRSAGLHEEALEWCRRTIDKFPGDLAATTALAVQGRIHLVRKDYQAALDCYNQLLGLNLTREGPRAPNRSEVIFMRGYCLEQLGEFADAIDVYLTLPSDFNGYFGSRASARLRGLRSRADARPVVEARLNSLRRQSRQELRAGKVSASLSSATQALRFLGDESEKGPWLDHIRQLYQRIPAYRSWIDLRVRDLGRAIVVGETASPKRTHESVARELFFLGLFDEGAPELAAAFEARPGRLSPSQLVTLAALYNRGNHPDEALRIGELLIRPMLPPRICLELLPTELVRTLYPVPFTSALRHHALDGDLDPRFMLAIMRQESLFRTDAKSIAAARGLMQLIPSTAERLAVRADRTDFDLSNLYDPVTSIQLGALHMEELLHEFPDNLYAVAAAYNGGDDNVRRWLDRAECDDPDLFVGEIAFHETKTYVYKVMTNLWAYQRIVSEHLD